MQVRYHALAQPALWCLAWGVALAHPGLCPSASRTFTPGLVSSEHDSVGLTQKRPADNQLLDLHPEYPGGSSYQTSYRNWRSSQSRSRKV
jgi:hypothetical protein